VTNVVRETESDERDWQELVVRHLGLKDWLRFEVDDELDAVGPVARDSLRRHGLLWPFNAHFHAPLLRAAAGGSLLTGIGGDELFGGSPTRVSMLLARRVRPNVRDLARVGLAFGPRRVRSAVLARRLPLPFYWLHPAAQRQVAAAWGKQAAAEPRRWRDQVHWWRRLRYFRIGLTSLALLAEDENVNLVHPFAADTVATALSRTADKVGPQDRAAAMKLIVADLLPDTVLERSTKAQFDAVFWNRHSRDFVTRWDGQGADRDLVDLDVLRALWSSSNPPAQTFTQLQAAWLASEASEAG
jgi:asparagine synthetase B (glutamine-hydrolysing)